MFTINTYNKITNAGLDLFDRSKYQITDVYDNPDLIMVQSAPLHDLEFKDNLKAVIRVGAGFNTIPVEKLTKLGVAIFNTPGANANAVKELVVSAMITVTRKAHLASKWAHELECLDYGKDVEKAKEIFRGSEIYGKKVGIIGLGHVGFLVARALHNLGMDCMGYDPYLNKEQKDNVKSYVKLVDNLDSLYETCDYITVHTPFNDETKNLIDKDAINKMKQGVFIINYARGQVVSNSGLVEALKSGKVAGYATDFPTKEQIVFENVYATPHLGAATFEAKENCDNMGAREAIDYLENGNTMNSVNLPNISFARGEGSRITIIHDNVPGMLGFITEKVSKNNFNIENLLNSAKGDIAYTILDFHITVPDDLKKEIESIPHVIKVRIL